MAGQNHGGDSRQLAGYVERRQDTRGVLEHWCHQHDVGTQQSRVVEGSLSATHPRQNFVPQTRQSAGELGVGVGSTLGKQYPKAALRTDGGGLSP
jgi:hypothetical protein